MTKVTFHNISQGDVFRVRYGIFRGKIVRAARKYDDLVEMQIWVPEKAEWQSLTSIPPESKQEFDLLEPLNVPCQVRRIGSHRTPVMVPTCYIDEAEHQDGVEYWRGIGDVRDFVLDIEAYMDNGGWSYV